MTNLLAVFLAGFAVGMQAERWRARRKWKRAEADLARGRESVATAAAAIAQGAARQLAAAEEHRRRALCPNVVQLKRGDR